jgi:hypothetical protein
MRQFEPLINNRQGLIPGITNTLAAVLGRLATGGM